MYKPRVVEKHIKKALSLGKSVVLVGPRQAGKTTLLKHLAESYGATYLSLDDLRTAKLFEDVGVFAKYIDKDLFFLDEAQRDNEIGRKLKYLYDIEGKRFVVSGSGSFDVKVKISGELVGRAVRILLLPLSFSEFLLWNDERLFEQYREINEVVQRILNGANDELPFREHPLLEEFWKEYVVFGGYPEVVLTPSPSSKELILKSIVENYIEKDVVWEMRLKKIRELTTILMTLARSVGNTVSKHTLGETAGLSFRTVEHYLSLLEQTFLVFSVLRYPGDISSLRKSKKYYFFDTGLRNYLLGNLEPFHMRKDIGALTENYVARRLFELFDRKVYFYRKNRGEVDFIAGNTAIEVKTGKRRHRLLHELLRRKITERGVIVTLGSAQQRDEILVIPPWFI